MPKKGEISTAIKPTSFKFKPEVIELLDMVSERHTRNRTNTIEFLIRQEAEKLKLKLPK